MAKIVFPLHFYQEGLLNDLLALFPTGKGPYIAGVANKETRYFTSDLKEKISAKSKGVLYEMLTPVEKFTKEAARLKISYNIYYFLSEEYSRMLYEKSVFSDFIFYPEYESIKDIALEKLSGFDLASPMLLPFSNMRETKTVLVPILDESSIALMKKFIPIFKYFLKSIKVIVIAPRPGSDAEIRKEKYLIEFLRSHLPLVSFSWFSPESVVEDIQKNLTSADFPSLMVIPKKGIKEFRDFLNQHTVSIFTEN